MLYYKYKVKYYVVIYGMLTLRNQKIVGVVPSLEYSKPRLKQQIGNT